MLTKIFVMLKNSRCGFRATGHTGREIAFVKMRLFIFFYKNIFFFDSDIEQKEIVDTYATWNIPLDILVTDSTPFWCSSRCSLICQRWTVDWHITFYKAADAGEREPAGQTPGWTG